MAMDGLLVQAPVVRKAPPPAPPTRCPGTHDRPVSYSGRDGTWLCRSCLYRAAGEDLVRDGRMPVHDQVPEQWD